MNLMHVILASAEGNVKSKKYGAREKVVKGRELLNKYRLKVSDEYIKLGETPYFYNCLPKIVKTRDVLTKPLQVCKMRVNWKRKVCTPDDYLQLKEQYGWTTVIVDSEHTRNKYKNKSTVWVIFDTEKKAKQAMEAFNSMFITAMEQDTIDEYKHFRENPEKRVLSFDKILPTAYELYEAVDKGEA